VLEDSCAWYRASLGDWLAGDRRRVITIEIQGLPSGSALRARVAQQLAHALRPLGDAPVRAKVTFVDRDGPKHGLSIRCALTVRLPHRPVVRVEELSDTPTRAFRGSFATLERQLKKYRERRTERRRRPKKYYVAKRLLAEGLPPELVGGPRRPAPEDG